ncbi:MAG: ATP-binding cassette domain-containing protein [Propionibacteriaceae bacterium]|jgi:ABC-2 type transport system ATP-binding protein|nr:ATP-binding cassette domain-containing protein [Propionibacteriaceae bacterium]
MTTSPAITVEALTKRYGGIRAVDHLSFSVAPGEIIGFLGPNGSGKTTTMRCLMGLSRPDSGRIRVFGHPAGSPEALALTGCLIEEPALHTALSGRDHLRVIAAWAGVPLDRVDEVLSLVGLSGVGRRACGRYSLGMKQRLGLATALLKDPALVVLDEPGNGLDPAGLRDLRRLLRASRDAGHTILFSSHMLSEIEAVADRLIIVSSGQLTYDGVPGDLLRATGKSTLSDAFLALTQPEEDPA